MMLEKKPFTRYDLNNKTDVITLRLNDEERELLEKAKVIIEQERDGTAIKQLMMIGLANVIHDPKTLTLLAVLFKNKRNNKRQGIVTYDPLG